MLKMHINRVRPVMKQATSGSWWMQAATCAHSSPSPLPCLVYLCIDLFLLAPLFYSELKSGVEHRSQEKHCPTAISANFLFCSILLYCFKAKFTLVGEWAPNPEGGSPVKQMNSLMIPETISMTFTWLTYCWDDKQMKHGCQCNICHVLSPSRQCYTNAAIPVMLAQLFWATASMKTQSSIQT